MRGLRTRIPGDADTASLTARVTLRCGDPAEMTPQRIGQATVVCSNRRGTRHDDQVQPCQQCPVPSEGFADQAFQAVAVKRPSRLFLRYRQAESGRAIVARCGKHGEVRVGRPGRPLEDSLEGPRICQAGRAREPGVGDGSIHPLRRPGSEIAGQDVPLRGRGGRGLSHDGR